MTWEWLAWFTAAAITAMAVGWARPVASWVRWLPPLVLFSLAGLQEELVAISALLLISTVWTIRAAGDDSPAAAAAALSDILLLVALSTFRTELGLWELPSVAQWETASPVIAAAAGLRMLGGILMKGPVGAVVWWHGAALAVVAGPRAAPALVLSGTAFLTLGLALDRRSSVSVASGLALLSAALGGGPLALAALGLAGFGFFLGETRATLLVLAAVPLTPAASQLPTTLGLPAQVAAVTCLVLLSLCISRLSRQTARRGGVVCSASALAVAAAASPHPYWVILAVAVAAAVFVRVRGVGAPSSAIPWSAEDHRAIPAPRWVPVFAVGSLLLGACLWLRLLTEGLRSGFV